MITRRDARWLKCFNDDDDDDDAFYPLPLRARPPPPASSTTRSNVFFGIRFRNGSYSHALNSHCVLSSSSHASVIRVSSTNSYRWGTCGGITARSPAASSRTTYSPARASGIVVNRALPATTTFNCAHT